MPGRAAGRCVCPRPVLGRGGVGQQTRFVVVESVPKTLIVPLPVLFVSGLVRDEAVKRRVELFGKHGPYECPVYKYPVRGDGYPGNPDIKCFIFYVTLKCTPEKPRNHWTLRGVALLANETA